MENTMKLEPPLILLSLALVIVGLLLIEPKDTTFRQDWEGGYQIIQQSYLSGNTIAFQVRGKVLASLMNIEDNRLFKIIECESNFRNVCNSKGCKYGIGLGQIIPSTLKYCEEKLNKKLDALNPMDNIECCNWLIKNEGTEHWGSSTTDWGSWDCWKALDN